MITALLLAAALQIRPSPAAGHWQGYMERGAARLAVRFDFPVNDPSRGFFSAPDLGAIDIPVASLTQAPRLRWQIVGDTTTTDFDATIAGNSMVGTFSENGTTGTLHLERLSISIEKPYVQQEVTFTNGAVKLAGTVLVPRTPGKHPAVIFIHGSGPEGRWATKYIADYVARHGIVALVYDKRGVGGSTGDWRASTLQDLVGDARAGVDLLVRRSDVDRNNVGVYGHSQGAEIAPAIAEDNLEVKWIIAADGPVGPQYYQDLFRVNTALAQRYSDGTLRDAEKLYAEFVDVARTGASHDQLRADIRNAESAPWLDDLAIPADDNWIWNWYRTSGNYDNTHAWGTVRVPVLLIFGAKDSIVPPQESIAATARILKTHYNPKVSVRLFPGADHTERVPAATPGGWPHNAAGFPDIIATFVRSVRSVAKRRAGRSVRSGRGRTSPNRRAAFISVDARS